jgi:hypothetical protein
MTATTPTTAIRKAAQAAAHIFQASLNESGARLVDATDTDLAHVQAIMGALTGAQVDPEPVQDHPDPDTAAFAQSFHPYPEVDPDPQPECGCTPTQLCDECYYAAEEGPSCSICDALGHGYPGGGPCPLEDTGWREPEPEVWA